MSILMIGNKIIDIADIVEIEEKNITFSIKYTKKNPEPKPSGFFARMMYSDTIEYFEDESYFCLVLKVKDGIQMRGKTDSSGNVSMTSNQLYDFYAVYNDKNLIDRVQRDIDAGNTEKVCEIGNYFIYFGMLRHPDFLTTNTHFDETIKTKQDFIKKYM